jgi:hypothetical protein
MFKYYQRIDEVVQGIAMAERYNKKTIFCGKNVNFFF